MRSIFPVPYSALTTGGLMRKCFTMRKLDWKIQLVWGRRRRGLKLNFNPFRVEVRILLLLLLFLRYNTGRDFWFLFDFTWTQYDVGSLTSTKIKFICSLQRHRHRSAKLSQKLLCGPGALGAKELKHSVKFRCYYVILQFWCVLSLSAMVTKHSEKISHVPLAVSSLLLKAFSEVSRVG